jgi:hypothetical protein
VRFNLFDVENVTRCMDHVRVEKLDANGNPEYSGVPLADACIVVLHLETIHPDARGFRRGILGKCITRSARVKDISSLCCCLGYPYGFLSPGQFDVAIRFDVEDFGIHSVKAIPLRLVNPAFGGYSGGFRGI